MGMCCAMEKNVQNYRKDPDNHFEDEIELLQGKIIELKTRVSDLEVVVVETQEKQLEDYNRLVRMIENIE